MTHVALKPWRLAAADEECEHCGLAYGWELEVLCADCDAPMCPLCAVWISRIARCPGCAEGSGTG